MRRCHIRLEFGRAGFVEVTRNIFSFSVLLIMAFGNVSLDVPSHNH